MPFTLGLIRRFLDERVRRHEVAETTAARILKRANTHFQGKETSAISGRWGQIIFKEHPRLFEDLRQHFGGFMTDDDLVAFGKKAKAKDRRRPRHGV